MEVALVTTMACVHGALLLLSPVDIMLEMGIASALLCAVAWLLWAERRVFFTLQR